MTISSIMMRVIIMITMFVGSSFAFAACSFNGASSATILLNMTTPDKNISDNPNQTFDITCDKNGGSILTYPMRGWQWSSYFSDISTAYGAPVSDITARYRVVLRSATGAQIRAWDFDMKKEVTTSSDTLVRLTEPRYTLVVSNKSATYNPTKDSTKIISMSGSGQAFLTLYDDVTGTGGMKRLYTNSVFIPPRVKCTAASFEVIPSEKEVDFGLIDIRAINRGQVYSKDFSMEVRRKAGNKCSDEDVYPEIAFRHHGNTNSSGDLILPERRLLFRLLDQNGNKIKYGEKLEMGVLTMKNSLVSHYTAQVLKDPTKPNIEPGIFQATISYVVTYR